MVKLLYSLILTVKLFRLKMKFNLNRNYIYFATADFLKWPSGFFRQFQVVISDYHIKFFQFRSLRNKK